MSETTVSSTQRQQSRQSLRDQNEAFLWRTMDILGVTTSIERKVLAAVLIQFGVTLAIFLAPFVLSGIIWVLVSGLLFLGAVVAVGNTMLIIRRDFTTPIRDIETTAKRIAAGDLDVTIEESDQRDEIGSLTNAFADMQAYLVVVSAQADALARQDFDDDVLDEDVPGAFGESLDRMAANLEAYTTDIEEQVSESVETIETTLHDVDGIVTEVDSLDTTVQEISTATDDQAKTTQEAVTMVDEVASGSEETTAESETVAAAAEEQTTTISNVNADVRQLAERATELQSIIDEFTVESDSRERVPPTA